MAWYEDVLDGIGDKINELFDFTGEWCADVLDTGIRYYNKFIAFAYELVTKDIKDGAFQEFWDVVNFLNSVFISIATTLLVSMFFYSLFESSMESRAEVSMWRTVFDYLKLLIANLLVVNSLNIVTGIFRFGTDVAVFAVRTATGNAVLANKDAGLNEVDKVLFTEGVYGVKGMLILVVALIGAVVMIASAIMIIMEILKRFFKIFSIIPFAALSFCTYVLPDNKGGEMFRGYLKNTISTSIEAAIIVFCLVVSSSLLSTSSTGGGLLGELFDISDDNIAVKEVTLDSAEEGEEFEKYCTIVTVFKKQPTGTGSPYESLGSDFDTYKIVPNDMSKVYEAMDGEGSLMERVQNAQDAMYPATGYVLQSLSFGLALLLVVKSLLPMIITAGVIKEVPGFASKAIGM